MKSKSLLCQCNRGIFSVSELMVVHNDPYSFAAEQVKVVRCLYCGQEYLADLRPSHQSLTHVGNRKPFELKVREMTDLYKASLETPVAAPLHPEGQQERAR